MASTERLYRSEDLELRILAAALKDNTVPDWLEIEPADFSNRKHSAIWQAMVDLRRDTSPLDAALVASRMADMGLGAAEGILPTLERLPAPGSPEAHARQLRVYSARRRVIQLCEEAHAEIAKGDGDDALMGWLVRRVLEISQHGKSRTATAWDGAQQAYAQHLADVEARAKGERHSGIPTGLDRIDRADGGLPRGVVSIIAARPAVGKSSVALNVAVHAALKGYPVHFFTLEDSVLAFGQRLIAHFEGVSVSDIRAGRQTKALTMDIPKELRSNFIIEPAHGWSVDRIVQRARRQRLAIGTQLVVVDYLQLLSHRHPGKMSRNDLIGQDMEALAALAGQDNIAVLTLSQLSRHIEHRSEKTPVLADLRDSGNIEQVGKLIMALSANHDDTGELTSELTVSVLKNHQGMTGDFSVHFNRAQCRIS